MSSCPSCGKELPGEFPFCPFCAAPLIEQPSVRVQEERKVVSVLFCDLVGFTAASDVADPEDVRARIRTYHARLRQELERFGGTVEKFVGDAVMAVFGAPVAHEDDAERAVRAGLRLLEAIEELNADNPALSLQVRVGINTGEAVVALEARPELGEGLVTGDVVNTASRLQGVAPVNAVAVSEPTYRATERVFDWERLDPVTVKGKAEPLASWRPLRALARLGSDVTRTITTPLVGRELERSLLVGTFDRAAQQNSCQLVTVVGEPGVGKSRLCAELLTHVDGQRDLTRWRQGRCLPYGDGISFWALGEIVKSECGILESDTPAQAATKLEQTIPEDDPERAWLLARLAPLVGAPAEPSSQEESFAAWRRFCESLAADRTTVLVFEDLHWADPALLAFLEHLADWAEGVPLLLLCTARPELYERHATFGADARNAQRINLAPLSDGETAQLVSALLESAVLPAETQQQLLEQAGGNPLYAEEFVRLLVDRGGLGDEGEVPDSVQALIAARLDTLSTERKALLQDASVLGKVFWAGALAAMGDREPAEVEQALHELARKELVRPARASSMEGEREYAFWHVLVRDVCYGQIPRLARAGRHEAAAAWLEERAGERVEDLADVLAYHYKSALELTRAAGDDRTEELQAQAVRYLSMAGARALTLDVDRAEQLLSRGLELCPDGDPQRALLLERWALAAQPQGRLQEAREAWEEALELYRREDDLLAAGRVLFRLVSVRFRLGDLAGSKEAVAESIELLETQPPGPELVDAYASAAGRATLQNDPSEGVAAAERALALAAELGLPEPSFALHWRGLARTNLGEVEGIDDLRRALRLALEQNLGRETSIVYGNVAAAVWFWQGTQAALDVYADGLAYCERRGLTEVRLHMQAQILFCRADLGDAEEAVSGIGAIADRVQAHGDRAFIYFRGLELRLLAERGTVENAPDPDEPVAAARELGEPETLVYALANAARLRMVRGELLQAYALIQELDERTTDVACLSVDLCGLVRVLIALGAPQLAERFIAPMEAAAGPPLDYHQLAAAKAQVTEAGEEYEAAAGLHCEAAERWQEFGNVPERAYALLGQGRCLHALGDLAAAQQPLAEAREFFASMGYKPALTETEGLLQQAQTAAS
jgi:class 3 adenylate cyclase/tetratricopeptide (TPR) repeat protein